MINIAESLKDHRLSRGLTLMDIEKASGISNANLSRWENGQVIPNIEFCVRLAEFYGISVDELIGYKDTTNHVAEHAPIVKPSSDTAAFVSNFSDIIREKNFVNIAKLYKSAPKELRAVALGMIIGLMSSNGINTQAVLSY